MDSEAPIRQALLDAEVEIVDHEEREDGGLEDDEEKVTVAPKLILSRIKWIGDQITKVSRFYQHRIDVSTRLLCKNISKCGP